MNKKKLKAEFKEAVVDDNSNDSSMTTTSGGATSGQLKEETADKESANEEDQLDEGEEVLLQFDFDDVMNAKKKSMATSASAANLPISGSSNQLSTNQIGQQQTGGKDEETAALDSCDKEKMDVLKNKKPHFDIFADDDEYEMGTKNELKMIEASKLNKSDAYHLNDNWDDAEGYYSEFPIFYRS